MKNLLKNPIRLLLCALFAVMYTFTSCEITINPKPEPEPKPEPIPATHQIISEDGVYCNFSGSIGNDHSAWLYMDGTTGKYSYDYGNVVRTIRFVSYDPTIKRLVLEAYERSTGDYVGRFEGIMTKNILKGTFENYKGGVTTFNMQVAE